MSDPFRIDGPTCISFSGGRTSAYMLWRVLQANDGLPDDAVVCMPMRRNPQMDAVNAGASRQGGRQRAGADYQKRQARDMREFQAWCEEWAREALRVLKPGGHLLAFGGTRTYHRMVCAIEDAGFEVRDQIGWLYGSGFPKSLDVAKAIDKAEEYKLQAAHRRAYVEAVQEAGLVLPGNSRHDWTTGEHAPGEKWWSEFERWLPGLNDADRERIERIVISKGFKPRPTFHTESIGGGAEANVYDITEPATAAARQWSGWGTALKPAWEPIVLARKPLQGTVAANVLAYGTGALNIDDCRIGWPDGLAPEIGTPAWGGPGKKSTAVPGQDGETVERLPPSQLGRWPANVIHDGSDEVLAAFPDAPGQSAAVTGSEPTANGFSGAVYGYGGKATRSKAEPRGDTGSAARFFYTAKANGSDRTEGLHTVTQRGRNHHPTVKPTELMRYLCRLVTPPGGTVLDPFMGSGSTLKAAELEGFSAIGIELDPEYIAIARNRIASDAPLFRDEVFA